MKDIETRKDIDGLLVEFYKKVFADDLIGFIFTDVARLDLDEHLPIIGDFWETLLLGADVYTKRKRNPLQIHAGLHEKTPLLPEHFERWVGIFSATIDEMFAGERTEFAKERAEAIGRRMLNFVGGVEGEKVKIARN